MIELLDKCHLRNDFDCGKELLNLYLQTRAGQDMKRKLAACYVLTDGESESVIGYYTLSNYSIPTNAFAEQIRKRLPASYKSIPTTLLGRLAIDKKHQGKKYGKILLIDALKRSLENSKLIASFAVVVDPLDEEARNFYLKYDFIELPDSKRMFVSMKTLDELFR